MKDVTAPDNKTVEIETWEATRTEQVVGVAMSIGTNATEESPPNLHGQWMGIGKVKYASTIKNFKKVDAIGIFVVLEPRISGSKALNVTTNLDFSHYHIVDITRFFGGVWLLWNDNSVSLHLSLELAALKPSMSP
ncbi:hypothetical protein OIU79_029990 [Salix purpurea]|uniref:Uncharacterized protein n=1 Tax=Salix purpurea TaxID=77065 RepID=A0A9Q0ZW53_SALPP|nr:hypothetical protein OIU79_029990 [Salix purpurea]